MGDLESWFWPVIVALAFGAVVLIGYRIIDWDIDRMKRRKR